MKNSYNILFLEDEINTWDDLTEFFELEINQGDISVDFASTASEGLQKVSDKSKKTDIIVIDIILPDLPEDNELYLINSLDRQIVNNSQNTKGILTSAHKGIDTLKSIEKQKNWIVQSFAKPYSRKSLKETVLKILNLSNDNSNLNSFKEEIGIELYHEISLETDEIKFKLRRSVSDLIDAGKRIKLVKEKLPYGYFRRWIESELKCHYTTVTNLLRVADVFGNDVEKITTIGVVPTILYFLAAPSTPPLAREKVIKLIEDGENVSFQKTKDIIKEYRQNNNKTNTQNTLDIQVKPNIETITPHKSLEKQRIVQVIRSNSEIPLANQWIKSGNLRVFRGEPDHNEFRQSLPKEISLTIAFPPSKSYSLEQLIPPQSKSLSLFYSPFKDFDSMAFANMVQDAVELCTEGDEVVVFSFLPSPELLLIVDKLNCKCIVAEPDSNRCQNILSKWQTGYKQI